MCSPIKVFRYFEKEKKKKKRKEILLEFKQVLKIEKSHLTFRIFCYHKSHVVPLGIDEFGYQLVVRID